MAVLSKIREKSLILILIIGLALFAFVVGGSKIMQFFQSNKVGMVGSVNGETISQDEFTAMVKNVKAGNPNLKDSQATEQVWNNIISEKIYSSQLQKAGIVVGENDIWEAIINEPSIKNSPQFQNELGMFDEEALKTYIADQEANQDLDGGKQWQAWLNYENSVKKNLERSTYLNLIKSAGDVSVEEAKQYYMMNNTTVSGKYVSLPYTSVADSLIKVSESDIQTYINNHQNQFKVKASRDIRFVKFDLLATDEDKVKIQDELKGLLSDLKTEKGDNLIDFVEKNSDLAYDENFVDQKALNAKVADTLYKLNIGDVYGPYEDKGYYKISKLTDIKDFNTAKASHILISYKDAQNAKPEITRTKEEAQVLAKKILAKVKKANVDFAEEAKISSDGPTGAKGGSLGVFAEGRMVPAFNDWVFSHKKGDIGMVETDYGFHIIYLEDTIPARQFATIAKIIAPSEETENRVFVEAQSFVTDIKKGKGFAALAQEKKYQIKNAQKLSQRADAVPNLKGNNPQIVSWAFDEDSKVGDIKRFDIEKAYVVAQITQKEAEGIQSVKGATTKVRPILVKQKKADILAKKLQEGSLEDIAKRENIRVEATGDINFGKPGTSKLGKDKAVVGALLAAKEGVIIRDVRSDKAVFALQLDKKTVAPELSSYEPYRQELLKNAKSDDTKIFEALKEAAKVEDYRR